MTTSRTPDELEWRTSVERRLRDLEMAQVARLTGAPRVVTFTPGWYSASDPQPVIGNGTLSGYYNVSGGLMHWLILLLAGSSTTFGTGAWSFSLPTDFEFTLQGVASAVARDSDLVKDYGGVARIGAVPTGGIGALGVDLNFAVIFGTNTTPASPSVPITWANGDSLILEGVVAARPNPT